MGELRGFMKNTRKDPRKRPTNERILDWREIYLPIGEETLKQQGARCMDCGVPFCQGWSGCPVQNIIPEWNDLVSRGRWRDALKALHHTNNFPEFTGRLCPAPCESACVLGIIDKPVSIRVLEWNIIEKGFSEGWVTPLPPKRETGKKVAVIGSGPAGLAAAQQLRRSGHAVIVFEKSDRLGGLLRYGIPDFKMEKKWIDRRLHQLEAEGVVFKTDIHVGSDMPSASLTREFDAICLATGAEVARDLPIPGREYQGIHLAMDYLTQQNKKGARDIIDPATEITAKNKHVVILGGGDTGADCLGTCHRQDALEVRQIELLPKPPSKRSEHSPWPLWPMKLRTTPAHEEGGMRDWSFLTKRFSHKKGHVDKLHGIRVEMSKDAAGLRFNEIPGSGFEIKADLVLLALGFTGPDKKGLLTDLGVKTDTRGNVCVDAHRMTNVNGVFAAGDINLGASLIVWAIHEGREAAKGIERYLAAN
ncbi:MAG: glutamate synthase subunit beta [Nitrospiria bacterium]